MFIFINFHYLNVNVNVLCSRHTVYRMRRIEKRDKENKGGNKSEWNE